VQVLLVYSLEEAIQTADSMKARGYGHGTRSSYEYFTFKKRDFFALFYLIITFILNLAGRLNGYGYFNIYPVMETVRITSYEMMYLGFYLIFIGFPLFIELGGYVKWRLSH
jgi:energy-coupling factor transport system permease protein